MNVSSSLLSYSYWIALKTLIGETIFSWVLVIADTRKAILSQACSLRCKTYMEQCIIDYQAPSTDNSRRWPGRFVCPQLLLSLGYINGYNNRFAYSPQTPLKRHSNTCCLIMIRVTVTSVSRPEFIGLWRTCAIFRKRKSFRTTYILSASPLYLSVIYARSVECWRPPFCNCIIYLTSWI